MKTDNPILFRFWPVLLLTTLLALTSCSKRSLEGAGQGAVSGAAVGAVGGMVSALVFGGNVGEAAARGAVWGGSTGAAAGAISGAVADSNEKKAQQAAELETLRKQLGDDAFQGLAALVECKHEVALGYGRAAQGSNNPDYALAGLWLQVLAYGDSGQMDRAREIFPNLVERDGNLSSDAQAESEMQAAQKKLTDIRREHNLPPNCK